MKDIYTPRRDQVYEGSNKKNTYRTKKSEQKYTLSDKLNFVFWGSSMVALTLFGVSKCSENSKNSKIEVIDGPKGYDLVDYNIPLNFNTTRISEIHLGNDTLNMNITRNPAEGTVTYEGPITYKIHNPRGNPEVLGWDEIERRKKDTRIGSVTLKKEKSIEDHL